MKIGFEANSAIYEPAGVGEYTRQIMRALLTIDRENEYYFFANTFRRRAERIKKIEQIISGHPNGKIIRSNWPNEWKEWLYGQNWAAGLFSQFSKVNLIHAPFFTALPLFSRTTRQPAGASRRILTVHDLVFYRFPEHQKPKLTRYFQRRSLLAAQAADLIIADSQSTKNDLIKIQKIPAEKIRVIYLGKDEIYQPIPNQSRNSFILTVGTLEPRKNLVNLITAYEMLGPETQKKHPLLIVGGRGWENKAFEKKLADSPARKNIRLLGYVSKEALKILYNRAELFIYPSLFEGFGLPALEAMACGCPVLVSRVSSLPEVVGQAGEYFDPTQAEDIADKLKKVLTDQALQQKMRLAGLTQAAKFSWEKCGRETREAYQ